MKLYLGGHLGWYAPRRAAQLEIHLREPTPLTAVASRLNLPVAEIAIAAVNGTLVSLADAVVCDTDSVEFHPAVGGG